MKWIAVSKQTPSCLETGNWDGRRSTFYLLIDKHGMCHVGQCYETKTEGNAPKEFRYDFYNKDDFEIEDITHWMTLPELPIHSTEEPCTHDWYGIDQIHSKCRKCDRIERDD
jgi:hypothetical protein